jgi:hypothetical protein
MDSHSPPEIWHQVFQHAALTEKGHDWWDFANFWISGRQVCRNWRDDIPKVYRHVFLRDPKQCQVMADCKGRTEMVLHFDRIDALDKDICTFKKSLIRPREPYEPSVGGTDDFHNCWEHFNEPSRLSAWDAEEPDCMCCLTPPYVIRIYGVVNDTRLPSLTYSSARKEISFHWVGMLDAFCSEQAQLNRRNYTAMWQRQEKLFAVRGDETALNASEKVALRRGYRMRNLQIVRRTALPGSTDSTTGAFEPSIVPFQDKLCT